MRISAILPFLFAAGSNAMPAPEAASAKAPKAFGIMSLRSASPIHFSQVGAMQSNLFLNLPDQHAKCNGKAQDGAIFYIKDEQLFLYTPDKQAVQKVFVDRSGMGMSFSFSVSLATH